MIKVQYDPETGEVKNAFDSSIEVSGEFVTVSEDVWNSLAGMKLKVVDGALTADLSDAKEKARKRLWSNYKAHQTTYVDAEDLTLASLCAAGGSVKGKAVQVWVMGLWKQYYTVKDLVDTAENLEVLNGLDLTAADCGEPPYTIRELNEEAAAVMGNSESDSNESNTETDGE